MHAPRRLTSLLISALLFGAFIPVWLVADAASARAGEAQRGSCEVRANQPTLRSSSATVFASGSIGFSCAGWTKYCVQLVHEYLAGVPFPTPHNEVVATTCAPLKTGLISGSSTAAVRCYPGYYISVNEVFAGSTRVKRVTSAKYDYTGACPQFKVGAGIREA